MYILWIVSSKMSPLNWTTGGVRGATDYHYKGSREEETDYTNWYFMRGGRGGQLKRQNIQTVLSQLKIEREEKENGNGKKG